MFDFGFWELAIIGVITLIIVGPDKMPALAKKAGVYAGKASRFINKIKREIDEEMHQSEFKEIKSQITETVKDSNISQAFKETKEDLEAIKREGNEITDILNKKSDSEKAVSANKKEPAK